LLSIAHSGKSGKRESHSCFLSLDFENHSKKIADLCFAVRLWSWLGRGDMCDKENELSDVRYNQVVGLLDDLEQKYWHLHQLIFGHVKSVTPAMWIAAKTTFATDFLDMFCHLKLRYLQARALVEHECDCEFEGQWTYCSDNSSTSTKWTYFNDEASCIAHASKRVESYPIVVYHWQVGSFPELIAPWEQSAPLQDESEDLKLSWKVNDEARWLCI
jgi:hypothetical protein